MAKIVAMTEDVKQIEYRHGKCGALLVHPADEPKILDEEDCPVCVEVRAAYEKHGVRRGSPGYPLTDEIKQVFTGGEVGIK